MVVFERVVRFLFSLSLVSILSILFNWLVLFLLCFCFLFASFLLEVICPTSACGCVGGVVDSAFLCFRCGLRVSDLVDLLFVVVVSGDVC